MGRKFTGKTTVNRARIRQKNGDYYIYERKYSYNPDTKRTEMTANKLVAKIPKPRLFMETAARQCKSA